METKQQIKKAARIQRRYFIDIDYSIGADLLQRELC